MPEPRRDDFRIEYPPATLDTLVDVLDWHAERHGERLLVTIESQHGAATHLTYARLRIDALAVAAGLVERGCGAGDAVAVMLPTGSEFFAAFYGALYAGCVPVPLYPPARLAQLEDHLQRSVGILRNAEARLLITVPQARPFAQLLRARCETLRAMATISDLAVPRGHVARPAISADSTAFLQYTSGSTGNPKGVVLSHANLLANVRAMWRASRVSSADIFVSWLPLYHDMGLIGACIGSLVVGYRLVLMSPLEFLAKPSRWLWAIHRHRATLSAAPNFAYELCADTCRRRRARRPRPRLVATRLQRCGAGEQRHARTLRVALRSLRLQARSDVHGIRPRRRRARRDLPAARTRADDRFRRPRRIDATRLCEASSRRRSACVASRVVRRAPAGTRGARRRFVSARACRTRARPGPVPRAVGDHGYYKNPSANAALFAGDWLNTGDLGYFAAGELFLTGREKDLIIRRGVNIHPADLEAAVANLPGVRKGGVAVFAAADRRHGSERLIVLAETRITDVGERKRIAAAITRLAVERIGMPPDDIVLAPPRSVLKTSSGKIRRATASELYEQRALGRTQRAPWWQVTRLVASAAAAHAWRGAWGVVHAAWASWAWAVFVVAAIGAWLTTMLLPGVALRRRAARRGRVARSPCREFRFASKGSNTCPNVRLNLCRTRVRWLSLPITRVMSTRSCSPRCCRRDSVMRPCVSWPARRCSVRRCADSARCSSSGAMRQAASRTPRFSKRMPAPAKRW